jgi:hypothetical protein
MKFLGLSLSDILDKNSKDIEEEQKTSHDVFNQEPETSTLLPVQPGFCIECEGIVFFKTIFNKNKKIEIFIQVYRPTSSTFL